MPWQTPTLKDVRSTVRDLIRGSLPGADANVPNSVLRVLSDSQGALCHLTLQYIDWLALQLLPDTAETEWLDRHGKIWLVNSDGSTGRKQATFASGSATFTGIVGTIVPMGTQLTGLNQVDYETAADITLGVEPTPAPLQALDPGVVGNLNTGDQMKLISNLANVDATAIVVLMTGGVDTESDDDLRMRILHRIQNPPMGGAVADYVTWALAVPGVTRAWAAPEQGIGTITVRFLMDDLYPEDDGWPQESDVEAVAAYIDRMRPVAMKDCYVVAPIKQFVDVQLANLMPATDESRGCH